MRRPLPLPVPLLCAKLRSFVKGPAQLMPLEGSGCMPRALLLSEDKSRHETTKSHRRCHRLDRFD